MNCCIYLLKMCKILFKVCTVLSNSCFVTYFVSHVISHKTHFCQLKIFKILANHCHIMIFSNFCMSLLKTCNILFEVCTVLSNSCFVTYFVSQGISHKTRFYQPKNLKYLPTTPILSYYDELLHLFTQNM